MRFEPAACLGHRQHDEVVALHAQLGEEQIVGLPRAAPRSHPLLVRARDSSSRARRRPSPASIPARASRCRQPTRRRTSRCRLDRTESDRFEISCASVPQYGSRLDLDRAAPPIRSGIGDIDPASRVKWGRRDDLHVFDQAACQIARDDALGHSVQGCGTVALEQSSALPSQTARRDPQSPTQHLKQLDRNGGMPFEHRPEIPARQHETRQLGPEPGSSQISARRQAATSHQRSRPARTRRVRRRRAESRPAGSDHVKSLSRSALCDDNLTRLKEALLCDSRDCRDLLGGAVRERWARGRETLRWTCNFSLSWGRGPATSLA